MADKKVLGARVFVAGALALLFGSGVVVGFAWDRTASADPPEETSSEQSAPEASRSRGRIVDRVGLTVEQDALVDSLVAFHRGRMKALDRDFRPRYRAVVNDLREEIMGVLTDEQSALYQTLLDEHDAERRSRRSRRSDNARR